MTKKKKTSREKRALIGAVCTAAVILAGSTFAWFTSTDEVTNRLSASADYEVSVIESFTPPKNWTPGQVVKKEVAVVNTGNVDAFVHQEISGKLRITTESGVDTAPDAAGAGTNYVKLKEDEWRSLEAGSYLAWKPADSKLDLGEEVVIKGNEKDFTPDKSGLYIFRRAIDGTKSDGSSSDGTTFKYEGYYAVVSGNAVTYYKLRNISVAGLNIDEDGILSVAENGTVTEPTVKYAVEKEETVTVPLTYDGSNHRLVATYGENTTSATLEEIASQSKVVAEAYSDYLDKQAAADTKKDAWQTLLATTTQKEQAKNTAQNAVNEDNEKAALKQAAETKKGELEADAVAIAGTSYATVLTKLKDEETGNYDQYTVALDTATNGSIDALYNAYKTAKTADDTAQQAVTDAKAKGSSGGTDEYRNATEKAEDVQKLEDAQKVTAKALADAKKDLDNAIAELVSLKGSIDAQDTIISDNTVTDATTHTQALTDAESAYTAAKTASDNAESAYDTAQATADTAKQKYESLKEEYGVITNTNGATNVTIYINLTNEVTTAEAGKWQLLPTEVADASVAEFYYNSILASGETSSQLIKSVEMADTVTQGSFKEFDFDLNVVVKSAQVVYDDANQITPKAAIESIDGAKPSADTYTLTDTITWIAK